MATQDSLFDLFGTEPEQPKPPQERQPRRETEPPAANDPEVQRRIDALAPCRASAKVLRPGVLPAHVPRAQ